MGCAGSALNKSLRAELDDAGERTTKITYGVVTGGCQWKGLESKGQQQLKGNCVLALTDKRLVSRGLPGLGVSGNLDVPLENVKGCALTKKYPGGVSAPDVVKVDFVDGAGVVEAAYFLTTLGTQSKWRDQIKRAANV
jgi:hypothetical protein